MFLKCRRTSFSWECNYLVVTYSLAELYPLLCCFFSPSTLTAHSQTLTPSWTQPAPPRRSSCTRPPWRSSNTEYNMNSVSKELELPGAFILGAAAVPSRIVGMNAELMPLVLTEKEGQPTVNSSYFSSINPADGQCLQKKYSDHFSDCHFGLLGNLFACEGKPGKVIEVRAKKRTGNQSLVTALRTTLEGCYPDKSLALGGTFVIQKGKAKIHIMPREFSVCPLNTNDDVNKWLQHFEVSAPLICQSVLVSRDPGLDLRVEHTHCFSHHGEGGHYYIDTTPDSVEYVGYFLPAEFVYRIDRPKETHGVGRD
uniref:DUF1907 domain-containing protein n=1 Tax=Gouania willdenowi TaxID=441366 RepID=A0A8C5EER3_GOUWI